MRNAILKLSALSIATAAAAAATVLELFRTTPKELGPNGVTFWFIALLVLIVGVLCLVFVGVKIRFFNGRNNLNRTVNSSFRTAFLIGIGAVTVLALRSLGTLDLKDIILLGLVLILIEVYLRTRQVSRD